MITNNFSAVKRRRIISCFHNQTLDEKLCFRCNGMSAVELTYINEDFWFSKEKVIEYRRNDLKKTIGEKKIYLILDLDHTLLHTINLRDFDNDEMEEIFATDSLQNNLFFIEDMKMVTKLRPFLFDFLKQADELFKLCIYTTGSRKYAKRMANLIDPDSKLFEWRIISRDDGTVMGKKGLDVVLAEEKTVLIVDDKVSVWSDHERNLINVDGFHFFGAGKCIEKRETEDDVLLNVFHLLKNVHSMFFDSEMDITQDIDRDVRDYLNLAQMDIDVDDEKEGTLLDVRDDLNLAQIEFAQMDID